MCEKASVFSRLLKSVEGFTRMFYIKGIHLTASFFFFLLMSYHFVRFLNILSFKKLKKYSEKIIYTFIHS